MLSKSKKMRAKQEIMKVAFFSPFATSTLGKSKDLREEQDAKDDDNPNEGPVDAAFLLLVRRGSRS